jgi:hypothetical protein
MGRKAPRFAWPTGASQAPVRLSALRHPSNSGERSEKTKPGRKNASRERDGMFEMVSRDSDSYAVRRPHPEERARRRRPADASGARASRRMRTSLCMRPHASRRIASQPVCGSMHAPLRCDAPQHEGGGWAAHFGQTNPIAHFGQTNPTIISAKRSQASFASSPRKRGPMITSRCSWVPALAALSRDDNRVRSREEPTCGCTK